MYEAGQREGSQVHAEADAEAAEALWALWRLWRKRSHPTRRGVVTPEQYELLRRLQCCGPLTVSALARELGVTPATVTVTTRRLEAAGYVQRMRQAADQRVVTISLSQAGQAATAGWVAQRRQALRELLAPLDAQERRQLLAMLQKMLATGPREGEVPPAPPDPAG